MRSYPFIFFLFLSSLTSLQGQTNLDSLIDVEFETRDTNLFHHYTKIIQELLQQDVNRAREFIDLQMELADELGDPNLEAFADNINSVYYSNTSDYAKSKTLTEELIVRYKKMGNMERVSAMLNNLSICNKNLGDLPLALENQMESLRIKDSLGVDPSFIAASYWNISNIFYEIKDIDQSTSYLRKALKIYVELGDKSSEIQIKDLLASDLMSNKDSMDVVRALMKECIAYYKANNYMNDLAGMYEALGTIEVKEDNFDVAEGWYSKALAIAEKGGERRFPGILYRRLAYVYREKGNYEDALVYGKKALSVAKELKLLKKEINDHLELASIYEEMGNHEKALESYTNYHVMNDSILSNERILAMTELETKYQTEKKEQEIILLEEREKISKLRQSILILTLIGLSIFLFSLWSYFRQKAKRDRLEKEKLDQEIAFKTKDLDFKKQELTAFALQLSQKNELLENLKKDIKEIKIKPDEGKSLQSLINTIQINQTDDDTWENFKQRFEQVHVGFNKRIKEEHPELTANDLRIISLIKMNLSSKEIANILNISSDGIKKARYRLRKKLGMVNEDNLEHVIITY